MPRPQRPEHRLPAAARRAVRELEAVFVDGTDAQYHGALARLAQAAAGLDAGQRARLDAALAAARERAEAARHLRVVAAALAGPWRPVRRLPGAVELVELTGHAGGQLLLTVPAVEPGDSPSVAERVAAARAALAAAGCPHCRAVLAYRADGQVFLAHARRCRLHEEQIARARSVG